jgi:HD superfamily phosphohydrolase YqeK
MYGGYLEHIFKDVGRYIILSHYGAVDGNVFWAVSYHPIASHPGSRPAMRVRMGHFIV